MNFYLIILAGTDTIYVCAVRVCVVVGLWQNTRKDTHLSDLMTIWTHCFSLTTIIVLCIFLYFFNVRLFMVIVFFIPATANDFRLRRISIPDCIHYIFVLSLFLRKCQYFPFQCWVLNKETTGTIFITSLVWRGPWLGIEPWTSRTRSQHYTTRISRKRNICLEVNLMNVGPLII